MHVVHFEQSVSRQIAAAFAMRTAVRRKHGVPVIEKHSGQSQLAGARIRDSMQDDDSIAIRRRRPEHPCLQHDAVTRGHLDGTRLRVRRNRPARWMQGGFAQHNARQPAKGDRNGGDCTNTPEPPPRHHFSIRAVPAGCSVGLA